MGYEVAHTPMGSTNFMTSQDHKGVLVLKSGRDPFNEDVLVKRYTDFNADMLISLKEPWVFQYIHSFALNWVPYAPIDHSPVSPEMTNRMHDAFRVIVPSRFAQRELKDKNIENVHYIPHGVNTDVFKPLESKEDCKNLWFIEPDTFVILIVAMNRVRKMNPRAFRGYKRFKELNPDVKVQLMFWGDMTPTINPQMEGAMGRGVADVGVNLLPEVLELGLGEAIMWPDTSTISEGIPEWTGSMTGWDMVKLYNSADVLLHCTGGEGFGMPLIEAQACGVPVITTEYAAAPEQVGAGLTVKADDYGIFNTPGARRAFTSIDGMGKALTKIMNADSEKLSRRARRFAMRYEWSTIMDKYFKPFLDNAENDLKPLITKGGKKSWA